TVVPPSSFWTYGQPTLISFTGAASDDCPATTSATSAALAAALTRTADPHRLTRFDIASTPPFSTQALSRRTTTHDPAPVPFGTMIAGSRANTSHNSYRYALSRTARIAWIAMSYHCVQSAPPHSKRPRSHTRAHPAGLPSGG